MQTEPKTAWKELVLHLIDQSSQKITSLPIFVNFNLVSREMMISDAVEAARRKGIQLPACQLFYKDHSSRTKVFLGTHPLPEDIKVNVDNLYNNILPICFRKLNSSGNQDQMLDEGQELGREQKKGRKIKERNIGEALKAVKLWRELYDTADLCGRRKYTLEEAAKLVGIAKKTLDDYFNHFRVASSYKFDFEKFSNQKVGVLRKFVKAVKSESMPYLSDFILDQDTDQYWIDFQ